MTMQEADSLSRNYTNNGIRNYPIPSTNGLQYQYTSKSDGRTVTLQFDDSQLLAHWSEGP
jgi:hypothetical protein